MKMFLFKGSKVITTASLIERYDSLSLIRINFIDFFFASLKY